MFLAAVGMLRKKKLKNHHSKAETISKLTVYSHTKNLTWQINIRTLERVFELKAHYPIKRKYWQFHSLDHNTAFDEKDIDYCMFLARLIDKVINRNRLLLS